jgi:hypothetical protein
LKFMVPHPFQSNAIFAPLRTEHTLRRGKLSFAEPRVAASLRGARPRHGSPHVSHHVLIELAKPFLGLRDRAWRRLRAHIGFDALRRGPTGGSDRLKTGIETGLHRVDTFGARGLLSRSMGRRTRDRRRQNAEEHSISNIHHQPPNYQKEKMRFQSFFMLMTIQLFFFASS